jgi:hypothetical protein
MRRQNSVSKDAASNRICEPESAVAAFDRRSSFALEQNLGEGRNAWFPGRARSAHSETFRQLILEPPALPQPPADA